MSKPKDWREKTGAVEISPAREDARQIKLRGIDGGRKISAV